MPLLAVRLKPSLRLFINLTPYIPLSFKGEGEEIILRGATPLFYSPYWKGNWLYKRGFLPHKNFVFAGTPYSPLFNFPPRFIIVSIISKNNYCSSSWSSIKMTKSKVIYH